MPGNMLLHAVAIVAIIALTGIWTTTEPPGVAICYNFWIFLALQHMRKVKIPFRTDSKINSGMPE